MRVLQAVAQALSASLAGISPSQSAAAASALAIGAETAAVTAQGGTSVTASVGSTGTGTCSSTVNPTHLVVSTISAGEIISAGDTLAGTLAANFPANTTVVSQLSGTTGGTGTYIMSAAATSTEATPTAFSFTSNVLNVTAVGATSNALLPDGTSLLTGTGVTGNVVTSQIAGTTGGIGQYLMNGTQATEASETVTQANNLVNVSAVTSGTLYLGSGLVGGTSVAFITGFVSGTAGGVGVYTTSVYQEYASTTVDAYGGGTATVPAGPQGPVAYTAVGPLLKPSGDNRNALVGGLRVPGVVLNPPRPVAISSSTGTTNAGVTFTVTGLDRVGMAITEAVTGPAGNATVNTLRLFAVVYSITASAAFTAVEAGWDGTSYSRWINLGNRMGNYQWKLIVLSTAALASDVFIQATSEAMNAVAAIPGGSAPWSATDDNGSRWTGGDFPDDIEQIGGTSGGAITLAANGGNAAYTYSYVSDNSDPWAYVRLKVAAGADVQVVLRVIPTRTA
jgi:hypothetical protein